MDAGMYHHPRRARKFTGIGSVQTSQTQRLFGEHPQALSKRVSCQNRAIRQYYSRNACRGAKRMQETPSIKAWQVLVLGIGAVSLIQILGRSGVGLVNLLAWAPGTVESGEFWRLVTHAFVMIDPLSLIFELLFIWFVVPTVEEDWGPGPVLLFFLAASAASAGSAMLLGAIGIRVPFLFGPGAALLGFMYAFSKRNPDQTFLLFFVVPVQAKWFVAVYVAMRAVFSVSQPAMLSLLLAELAGALVALGLRSLIVSAGKRSETRRRVAAENPDKALAERNARIEKLVRTKPESDEASRILEAEKNRTFDFTVCPPADFSENDRYCQRCEAFGHCLARSERHTRQA